MADQLVCPWCQTEITWDEEIGAEDICPHCFGELNEYRTVQWTVDDLDDDSEEEQDEAESNHGVPVELERYSAGYHCNFCEEEMVKIGLQTVGEGSFRSYTPAADLPPLVQPPFVLDVNLCPSCLQVQYSLGDLARKKWQKSGF